MSEDVLSMPESFESTAGVKASIYEYLHACPVCFETDTKHYVRVPSLFNKGEYIRYERCTNCGVVFRNPRLPSTYREKKYEETPMPEKSKRLAPRNQLHYRFMMREIERHLPDKSRRRLLDFGCGAGGFMLEAKIAGFDVMGLELSKDLANHCREEHGLDVYQGLITDPEFADEKFDLIISSQVFEHLVDPRGTLEEARRHLRTPGLFLIEVPNLTHIKERLNKGAVMDDSHLFYFSSKSLPRMFEDAGFSVLAVQQGARLYRVLGRDKPFPDWVHGLGMKVSSTLGVRTGLSVLARLD
ncbi:MAG: class I SAM-dependent methyltransferase [Acidobacteriota bacterium]